MAIETVQIVVGDAWALLSAAASGAVDARVIIGPGVLFSFGASEPVGRDGALLPRFASASFADKVWARCPTGYATLSVLRTVDAGNPALPALGTLTLSGGEFQIDAAVGTEIGTFGGLAAGDVIDRIVPNDGRVVLNADRTKLLKGLTASEARAFKIKVYTSNPRVPGNPKAFDFTVTPVAGGGVTPPALSIAGSPGGGEVGTGSTFTPIISGGTAPYTLSLASGTLPPGRTVNGAAKTVTGSYTTAGSYSYVLRATDAAGKTADLPVSVTIMPAGSAPKFGLVSATADGSTGQTYTLNAPWTGLQWHRMALAAPFGLTPIAGATASTYVATAADEGSRLVVTGTDAGTQKAAKALHVVYPAPVLLENFESLTGWAAANGGVLALANEGAVLGTKRLAVSTVGAGPVNAIKTLGSYDTSALGTIAVLADIGLDPAIQGSMAVNLRKGGGDRPGLNFGTIYETPTFVQMGRLWGWQHVSEDATLAASGGSEIGLNVLSTGTSKPAKFDALLGKAGGRPTVILTFDDNKVTQYTYAFPLMRSLGLPGTIYNVRTTASNPAALNLPKIQEMYAADWDVGLDSTDNDDITASFGTMAAAAASWQRGKDYAVANGITRGNEHGCWTGGQIQDFPNAGNLPSNRIFASSATSDGSDILNLSGVTAYPSGLTPQVGMRVTGYQVPNSPKTTIVEVISATQVRVSASIPAQTTSMYLVDESLEFYTMKTPVYYRDVLGMRTMRTTRADGGMLTRFGLGDRGMFTFGNALHNGGFTGFKAKVDDAVLKGLTIEFYTHGIIPGGGGVESDEATFTLQMQYLAQLRDAGLLDVMTWSEVWARDGSATIPANIQPPPTVVPSGVSYVGGSSANNAPAMPAGHKAGDLLLAFAYRDGGNAPPTLPAGWTQLSSAGADSNAFLLAYKIATSDAEPAATFANATNTIVQCYRGVSATTPIGAVSPVASGSSGSANVQASSWALQKTDGTSWAAYFGGSRSASSAIDTNANRVGHTNATSGSDAGGYDTYGPVTTLGNLSIGNSGGTFWFAVAVELRAT